MTEIALIKRARKVVFQGEPGSRVDSTAEPWKYFAVNSGVVIASQICSGVAPMKTW